MIYVAEHEIERPKKSVDAKDEAARAFYDYHNFVSFVGQPLRLYLPMTLIAKQFSSS